MTKAEMIEDIIDLLEELGIVKITDSPTKRPNPSAILPKNHYEFSCISENTETSEAPLIPLR